MVRCRFADRLDGSSVGWMLGMSGFHVFMKYGETHSRFCSLQYFGQRANLRLSYVRLAIIANLLFHLSLGSRMDDQRVEFNPNLRKKSSSNPSSVQTRFEIAAVLEVSKHLT